MTTIPGYKRKSFHHPARVNLTYSDLALEDPTSTQPSGSVPLPSDQRRRSLYVETNIAGKHAAEKMFLFEDVSEGIYEGMDLGHYDTVTLPTHQENDENTNCYEDVVITLKGSYNGMDVQGDSHNDSVTLPSPEFDDNDHYDIPRNITGRDIGGQSKEFHEDDEDEQFPYFPTNYDMEPESPYEIPDVLTNRKWNKK